MGQVRITAATALGTLNDPNTIDALSQALFARGDLSLRKAAAESLAKIRDPKVLQSILKALNEAEPGFRLAPLESLALRREPEVIPALVQALKNNDGFVRRRAAYALRERVLAHPDLILQIPPDARHQVGRIDQEQEHKNLLKRLCDEATVDNK